MIFFKILFFIGVVAIPFSGVSGIGALGELSNEASTYIFLPLLLIASPIVFILVLLKYLPSASYRTINIICLAILAFMAYGFLANYTNITNSYYLGRSGMNKFITSTLVLIYGMMLSYFAYALNKKDTRIYVVMPTAVAAGLCCLYSFFEIMAQFSGASLYIAETISSFIHNDPGVLSDRLRSVAYEPPALANYAAFSWPWLYAGYKYSDKRSAKFIYFTLWIAMTLLPLAAVSRTGMLTVLTGIIGLMLLNHIYLSKRPVSKGFQNFVSMSIVLSMMACMTLIFVCSDYILQSVIYGDSVSNISRLASNMAAFKMMMEQPLTGFGWGQYGFRASNYLPSWAWNSWEIRSWFSGAGASTVWPPVFSIYARFGAEFGIIGIILWISLWVGLARKILKISQAQQDLTGKIPKLAKPLIISCLCVLWTGIPLDSLRMPMIWIVLGLSCRFIDSYKKEEIERASSGHKILREVKSGLLTTNPKKTLSDKIIS